jgi:hypothetical protein
MNMDGYQRLPIIVGDDAKDSALLRRMAADAQAYLESFKWCPPISSAYLASGVGGIAAVFLFEFLRPIHDTDDRLWVIVGDLPSAYLVVEIGDSPADAMERYCGLMEDWIAAVRDGTSLEDAFPVAADRTPESALVLEKRVAFLLAEIIPRMFK